MDSKEELNKWLRCTRCGLCKFRRKVVLGRGKLRPADILFVGEGPGKSEDLTGQAFFGASGRILNTAVGNAFKKATLQHAPTYYITNVVACRPCDVKGGPNREPTREEAWACWPRLEATARVVRPRVTVLLGKVSQKFCGKAFPGAYRLVHPAYILRKGGQSSPLFRDFVEELVDVLGEAAAKKVEETT